VTAFSILQLASQNLDISNKYFFRIYALYFGI
jgi:hypothetical protein